MVLDAGIIVDSRFVVCQKAEWLVRRFFGANLTFDSLPGLRY